MTENPHNPQDAYLPQDAPKPPPRDITRGEFFRAHMAPLYAALAKAQAAFKPLERDRTVTVRTRNGGSYSFDYATLGSVHDATRAALSENGLSITGVLVGGADGYTLDVTLAHASGATLTSTVKIHRSSLDASRAASSSSDDDSGGGRKSEWQALGSAITYARRYIEQTMLGVAAEWDDDGNAADGHTVTDSRARNQPQAPNKGQPRASTGKRPDEPTRQMSDGGKRGDEQHPHAPPGAEQPKRQTEPRPAPTETKPPASETQPAQAETARRPPPLPQTGAKPASVPPPAAGTEDEKRELADLKTKILARIRELFPGEGQVTPVFVRERCMAATGVAPGALTVELARKWLETERKDAAA